MRCLLTGSLSISAAASIYLIKPPYAIGSVPVYRVTHLRTDGVHCRESAGTGLVVQGSSSNGCCLCIIMDQLMRASLFPHPLYYYWYEVWSGHYIESIRGGCMCVYMFIKLHITAQSGLVILVILRHSHWSSRMGTNDTRTYYKNLY